MMLLPNLRPLTLLASGLSLLVLAAACGGDDTSGNGDPSGDGGTSGNDSSGGSGSVESGGSGSTGSGGSGDSPYLDCEAIDGELSCSCSTANDGVCDEQPEHCPVGTDGNDCLCPYANDGMCDEPQLCSFGTDVNDCGAPQCDSVTGTYDATRSRSTQNPGSCPSDTTFNTEIPIRITGDAGEPSGYLVEVGYSDVDNVIQFTPCTSINILECRILATCEPAGNNHRDEVDIQIDQATLVGTMYRTTTDPACTMTFDVTGLRQ